MGKSNDTKLTHLPEPECGICMNAIEGYRQQLIGKVYYHTECYDNFLSLEYARQQLKKLNKHCPVCKADLVICESDDTQYLCAACGTGWTIKRYPFEKIAEVDA